MRDRMKKWMAGLLAVVAGSCAALQAHAGEAADADGGPTARYRVQVVSEAPLRLAVEATLPAGQRLLVASSRPMGIAGLDEGGWPALVRGLSVRDATGAILEPHVDGDRGWTLDATPRGRLALRYVVDHAAFAEAGWPAPRESVYRDEDAIVLAGRAVFVAVEGQGRSEVELVPPRGWHVASPWRADAGTHVAATTDDLFDNLFAFSRRPPLRARAGRLDVAIVPTGPWAALGDAIVEALAPLAKQFAGWMPPVRDEAYVMVLLPQRQNGGESFRNSFAMNLDDAPSPGNRGRWGTTLAHELFHYWNGWRLRGREYAATQWFQEGFTEYVANKAALRAGLLDEAEFRERLAAQLAAYRTLETPLDAPGTRKGPPLYGGGALLALWWDGMLADDTNGASSLEDLFAALWRDTGMGARPYDWPLLRATLGQLDAAREWEALHARHVAGREPVPVADALAAIGLQLVETEGEPIRVEPASGDAAERRRDAYLRR